MAEASSTKAVDLVIRFTTSIPDLVVTVASPQSTTTLSLKQRIRSHLPPEAASNRLRLISAGRVLGDTAALSKAINMPAPPPRQTVNALKSDPTSKGKAPLLATQPTASNARVYVHCSVGDSLSSEELAAERTGAEAADAALAAKAGVVDEAAVSHQQESRTTPAPRGFDRLLTAGFSGAEVATLRTQFLAIQSHAHTPDTMPNGDELRELEDRWLDSDAGGATRVGAGGSEGGGVAGAEDAGLGDMLWGNIMGFFWPVAAVCWLMREEGVWSRRRQVAVLSGMLVNIAFGFIRLTS